MVITPEIEGDYKTAAAIYEDMLMNNAEPSGHAIALQVLSQTGRSAQFKSIIESMLAQELDKNPELDIAQYINEIAGKICAVKAEPPRGWGYRFCRNRFFKRKRHIKKQRRFFILI